MFPCLSEEQFPPFETQHPLRHVNSSAWGLNIYGPFTSSTLMVKNNVITGLGMGLYLDDSVTFAGKMTCQLLNNGVEKVPDVGVYLGVGVRDCLVVCKSPIDTVVDLGTHDKIVGCHPPTIATSAASRTTAQPK